MDFQREQKRWDILSGPAEVIQYETRAGFWVEVSAQQISLCYGESIHDGQRYITVYDINTNPQKQGIGRRAIDALCDTARESGAQGIIALTVLPESRPFWQKMGFRSGGDILSAWTLSLNDE